jgi:hypothetical protein
MPPHPFMPVGSQAAPWQQFNDPLADKRQDLFYKDQEIGKLCRSLSNTMQMLDDDELTVDTRNELLQRMCDLTNMKTKLSAERVKMAAEFHEAEQRMLSERAARHREEEHKEERDNKMTKYDGMRGGKSSRGGRGGRS